MIKADANDSKQKLSLIVIGASFVALILGIAIRTPLFDTFSLGAWAGFISFLLSLGTVRDTGNNFWAKTAFWISFASMTISIFLSANA